MSTSIARALRGAFRLRSGALEPAVAFGLAWNGWQVLAGPITLLLIARFFTPELQGYYYTFNSLVALQPFFELGFTIVILNLAAHEWAHLALGPRRVIEGDVVARSRLIGLGRLVFGWFVVAGLLFFVTAFFVGSWLLGRAPENGIAWQGPWIALALVTALSMITTPLIALLEGCNQVLEIQRFGLVRAILSNLVGWTVLAAGGGLWTGVAIGATGLLCSLGLLLVRFRGFFLPFFLRPVREHLSWRREVWPMQWRLMFSGAVGYFAYSLFTPVMFRYHGAVAAGQMGMTVEIMAALNAIALVWLRTRTPTFGMLIARREFAELDRTWLRASVLSLGSFVVLGAAVCLLVALLDSLKLEVAQRVLPLPLMIVFLIGYAILIACQALSIYLRAHKQEPIMVLSIVTSLVIGFFVWQTGRAVGPSGPAWSFLAAYLVSFVWEIRIWKRCRREWHVAPSRTPVDLYLAST